MIVRHGHVIAQGWWKPEAAGKPHILNSLSKSFNSTAIGLAIADGKLNLDDPVLKFFPADAPADADGSLLIADWAKGPTGDVRITDKVVLDFASANMPIWSGWFMAALVVAGYAYTKISAQAGRRKQGLIGEPMSVMLVKIISLAVASFVVILALSGNRALHQEPVLRNVNGHFERIAPPKVEGVPWVVPVILILFVILSFVLGRTRYGRHIYAVGGNAEAARRAGVNVDRIRMSVFVVCSALAALSGIIAASYGGKVSASSGAGNVLLYAVGAAVIGGTSLFGGKGRALDAVIGGVVVATIANGLGLLNQSSYINFLVTGGVLLLAASVDAISRRRRSVTGLS